MEAVERELKPLLARSCRPLRRSCNAVAQRDATSIRRRRASNLPRCVTAAARASRCAANGVARPTRRASDDELRRQGFRRGLGAAAHGARHLSASAWCSSRCRAGSATTASRPAAPHVAARSRLSPRPRKKEAGFRRAGARQAAGGGTARRHRRALAEARRARRRSMGRRGIHARHSTNWRPATRISQRASTRTAVAALHQHRAVADDAGEARRRSARRAAEGWREGAERRPVRRCQGRIRAGAARSSRRIRSRRVA